jgi:protein tyrosine phosphatase
MLTDFEESSRSKYGRYFPLDQDEVVTFDSEKIFPEPDYFVGSVASIADDRTETIAQQFAREGLTALEFRLLKVEYKTDLTSTWDLEDLSDPVMTKLIEHVRLLNWPDFAVPEDHSRSGLVHLIRYLRPQKDLWAPQPSTIIHCSNGSGRTDVFIALDWLLQELDNGTYGSFTSGEDPIYELVSELRKQRVMMVQTEAQYAFLYEVLREEWLKKYGS